MRPEARHPVLLCVRSPAASSLVATGHVAILVAATAIRSRSGRRGRSGPDAHWIRRRGKRGQIRRAGTLHGNPTACGFACIREIARSGLRQAPAPVATWLPLLPLVPGLWPTSRGGDGFVAGRALCHHLPMAKTVIVKLTDDIDGGDADETVAVRPRRQVLRDGSQRRQCGQASRRAQALHREGAGDWRQPGPRRPGSGPPAEESLYSQLSSEEKRDSGPGPTCRLLGGSVTPGSRAGWRPGSPELLRRPGLSPG